MFWILHDFTARITLQFGNCDARSCLEDHPADHNWLVTGVNSPTYERLWTRILLRRLTNQEILSNITLLRITIPQKKNTRITHQDWRLTRWPGFFFAGWSSKWLYLIALAFVEGQLERDACDCMLSWTYSENNVIFQTIKDLHMPYLASMISWKTWKIGQHLAVPESFKTVGLSHHKQGHMICPLFLRKDSV